MHDFQLGDIIGYNSPDEGYIYGIVTEITESGVNAEYLDDPWVWFGADKTKVDYIEPIYIDDETALKFARYEISYKEVVGNAYPPQRVRTLEQHELTIDELLAVLDKASKISAEQFSEEWFKPIRNVLNYSYSIGDMDCNGDEGYRYLPSKLHCVWNAMDKLDDCLYDGDNDYSEIIRDLTFWKQQLKLPVPERQYEDWHKAYYIKSFDEENTLDSASDAEFELFIQYVNELCEKNNTTALYAKAYGCYGGNRAFKCDWVTSRDCLLRLYEIDENPFIANTLGYIFYYGRCNDGVPEYEKAFKFFSIGAAGGVYESQYKLSDMFRHGYGVAKNNQIASNIIWRLYDENIKYIFDSNFNCKFADVAFRAGNLLKDGIGYPEDANAAYYYYLQAEFAVRMRMLKVDYYGDAKVADSIRKAIGEILPETSYEKAHRTVRYSVAENILLNTSEKHRLIEMKLKRAKNGEMRLRFRVLPRGNEEYQPKLFLTEPKAHFCGLVENISASTVGLEKVKIGGRILKGDSAVIVFDYVTADEFYLYGKKVAEIECGEYRVVYPSGTKEQKKHFVSVVFNAGGNSYDYICDIPGVKVGDRVVVETNRGETTVYVVRVFDKDASETALPISKYKAILRKE